MARLLDLNGDHIQMIAAALIVVVTIIVNIVQRANRWINQKRMAYQPPAQKREPSAPGEAEPPLSDDPSATLMRELERALRGETEAQPEPAKPAAPTDQRGFPDSDQQPASSAFDTMRREAEADLDARRISGERPPIEQALDKFVAPAPARPMQPARPAPKPMSRPAPAPLNITAYDLDQPLSAQASLAVLRNRDDMLRGIIAHEILSPPRARRAPGRRA